MYDKQNLILKYVNKFTSVDLQSRLVIFIDVFLFYKSVYHNISPSATGGALVSFLLLRLICFNSISSHPVCSRGGVVVVEVSLLVAVVELQ